MSVQSYLNGQLIFMSSNQVYPEKTDEELVSLTLHDKENYQYLIQRYEGKLFRYIVRISGVRSEDAEDILQDVFIKAYEKLNDFKTYLKFSSWIYRIAHNETVSFLRKSNTRPKLIDNEENPLIMNFLRAESHIEQDIDRKNLIENIAEIINNLDEKYRDVLVLKYLEGKDYHEISDILKKPMGTVAILLKRAKEKINKEILKNNISI